MQTRRQRVFFHANTLHASGPNNTEQARNLLIVSYNATANQPANPLPFHQFGSLDVLPNDALANSERWPEIDVDTLLAPEAIEGGSDSYGYQVQRDPNRKSGVAPRLITPHPNRQGWRNAGNAWSNYLPTPLPQGARG